MSNFIPPSLPQKLKDFNPEAPQQIMDRAKDLMDEHHRREIIDREAFSRPFQIQYWGNILKSLFSSATRAKVQPSSWDDSFEKIWPYWRQAINEYMDKNDFPRETLTITELSVLHDNPSRPLRP